MYVIYYLKNSSFALYNTHTRAEEYGLESLFFTNWRQQKRLNEFFDIIAVSHISFDVSLNDFTRMIQTKLRSHISLNLFDKLINEYMELLSQALYVTLRQITFR